MLAKGARIDGYIRVSRVGGREGDSFISPDVQRQQIERWAQLRGVTIAEWFTDLDVTGGKLTRPGLDAALARIRSGASQGIAVARLDRFSRAGVADALKVIEEITTNGGEIAAVDLGIDPTTAFGEFATTLMLGLARMQRRQISDGWSESRRYAVKRGVHVSSQAPTGYRKVKDAKGKSLPLEVVPEYREPIRQMFMMKAAGASWPEMQAHMRTHGVKSPYGTVEWQSRALAGMIANRVYMGEARSGEFSNPDAHEAIVDPALWAAAQVVPGPPIVRNGLGLAILSRILRCEGCGYVLKADSMNDRGKRRRVYRCRTKRSSGRCPAPAMILGSVIEPFVLATFFGGLPAVKVEGTLNAVDLVNAEAALRDAETELSTYLAATSAAGLGGAAFAAGATQRQAAVDDAVERLNAARVAAGVADLPDAAELEAIWPDLTVDEQRRLLHAAFDAIVVRKSGKTGPRIPLPERVTVYWKGEAPSSMLKGWRKTF